MDNKNVSKNSKESNIKKTKNENGELGKNNAKTAQNADKSSHINVQKNNKKQSKSTENVFTQYYKKFKQIVGKQKTDNNSSKNDKPEMSTKNIKSKTKFVFKNIKSNAVVAIAMVFAMSILSVCSVLLAGNFVVASRVVTANVANTRIVQAKLAELGYYNQAIDGIYDNDTITAVKNYQQDNNLAVTGNLDQSTTTALGVTDNTQANTDLYLLAKLIYSEARGEIYEGQVAVGAVVLNRVRDAGFPNTIQGVIYQPWAFTALNDGQFALEPNSTAYSAAQDAMNGWDPTYGCIFYYNPTTATSSWIFSREIIVRIGNHVFCI